MSSVSFEDECKNNISKMSSSRLKDIAKEWINESSNYKYTYNFKWLGRPIIQFPQDLIAIQEIIWDVKPDLIIETGIAHGGSLIFHASILEMIGEHGQVIGVDIDIREHNKIEIEKHSMFRRIQMIQGSSIDKNIVKQVSEFAVDKKKILVLLDSNHTHEHVLKELEYYSPFVKKDSYIIVLDTIVEDMDEKFFSDRPWGKSNNPKTAVWEFLKNNNRFVIDKETEGKLSITVAPDGYLKCIKD